MAFTRRRSVAIAATISCGILLAGCAGGPPAATESTLSDGKVVLGVLNDQSGVYKDL